MKRALFLVMAVLATACGSTQPGATPSVNELRSDKLRVWFTSGDDVLPMYELDGAYYLLGTEGLRYEVGLQNLTGGRLEVVVSVDGRDVVSGEVADFQTQRGYVILPEEEIKIQGFRQSLNHVAAFRFVRAEESYASRMGGGENVGVIGAAVFEEVVRAPVAIAGQDREAAEPRAAQAPMAKADEAVEAESLGTEYGESLDSEAEITPFERVSKQSPSEIFAVYYDDRPGLERRGIVLPKDDPDAIRIAAPRPFPGAPEDRQQFAPPPPEGE